MDLLQIWCIGELAEPMARQTIKKPISRQGGPQVWRPIFGLNCEILHQTGGWRGHCIGGWRAVVLVQVVQFTSLAGTVHCCIRGQGPDTTLLLLLLLRYNLKAPQQHGTSSGQAKECVCQAVTSSSCQKLSPTAAKLSSCCHPITLSHLTACPKPFDTSLVNHLSSSCQSQALAAETFEKK